MGDLINFFDAKKRFDSQVVYIGDTVEWQDFNGDIYQNVVVGIKHKPLKGYPVGESMQCFPLWEKEEYILSFALGLGIIGEIVTRKVIKPDRNKEFK